MNGFRSVTCTGLEDALCTRYSSGIKVGAWQSLRNFVLLLFIFYWEIITLATWCKDLTHRKRPCCWERLRAGGGGDDRGWDGWMASPTPWAWVWANSGRQWRTGKPGVLQSTGSQRVAPRLRDWTTAIALPCCVSSCCTTMWITEYTYIPFLLSLPPTSLSHPSRSSQSTELSSLCYTAASH